MIDIENYVVNQIASALSDITVYSDYEDNPSVFPCVTVIEENNASADTFDNGSTLENHADLLYTVTVFSNLTDDAKGEAKGIMDTIDGVLQGMKFKRTFCQPLPNSDHSIFRYVARYTARVGKGVTVSDVTTYQIYR